MKSSKSNNKIPVYTFFFRHPRYEISAAKHYFEGVCLWLGTVLFGWRNWSRNFDKSS